MKTAIEDIAGMEVNNFDFEPKKIGSIYVTENTPIHLADEFNRDFLKLYIHDELQILFRISHVDLHYFFEGITSFKELVAASPNQTIYFTSNSKSIISNYSNIPIDLLRKLDFRHNKTHLSPYGKQLVKLNEVCASFHFQS